MARCLIPAAGLGTRMRPATRALPKELLSIGTRPMIQWCLTEALEGGFDEIGVVTSSDKPILEAYVEGNRWREGIHPKVAGRAAGMELVVFHQASPMGVVDTILSAEPWIEAVAPFAVFLPDNVRIAGPPLLTAEHVAYAAERSVAVGACHRVGPETRHYFGDVGRIEIDERTPADAFPRVTALQERGEGTFRAMPEGSWRLAPRYVVTHGWLEAAREELGRASLEGDAADDVAAHRAMIERGAMRAVPWDGTLVDAGNPLGYLYANHLLHEAAARERDARDEGSAPGLHEIER